MGDTPDQIRSEKHIDTKHAEGEIKPQRSTESLLKEYRDLESQNQSSQPFEHQAPLRSKLLYLAVYFVLNLALTLSNKALLGKVRLSHAHAQKQKVNKNEGEVPMATYHCPHLSDHLGLLLPTWIRLAPVDAVDQQG